MAWRGAIGAIALALALTLTPPAALPTRADPAAGEPVSTKAVLVAVRTFGFVVNPPVGSVDLAVVFNPNQPGSLADLRTVTAALTSGAPVGAAEIRPVPVPVGELGRLKTFRFVLMVGGVQPWFPAVADLVRGRGVLTISTDLSCVRAGRCVMGVAAEPRVQVLVSRAASEAADVKFAVAFLMMITEL